MRLKVLLIVLVLAATLSAPALAQTPGRELPQATSGSTVILFVGNPFTTGDAVTFLAPSGAVTADMANVNFVDIRVCNRGYVFAVERLSDSGQPISGTVLRVQGGTMTLAEVVARLEQACAQGRINEVSAALGANMMLSASAQAEFGAHTFLMVSDETGSRRIVAVTRLNEPTSADLAGMTGITHVRLQSGITGRVFAVAKLPAAGQPIGTALVNINGRTMTLAEANARLESASRGDHDLVVFTTGPTTDAVIVGFVEPESVELGRRIEFSGATHAHVLIGGHGRVFVITQPQPETFGTIVVCPAGESCGIGSNLFIEVIPTLRLEF